MEYSMSLEKIATDIYALVTGDTSQEFEQPISAYFFRRQRGCIPFQPTIKSAAWCCKSSLEACDGVHDVRGIRPTAVDGGELPAHVRIRGEFFRELGNAGTHDLGIFQRSFGVRLKRTEFSLPSEAGAERDIEYGKSVERKA